ncbi:MAG: signal peptidase I [Halanaerobiales bacterium]
MSEIVLYVLLYLILTSFIIFTFIKSDDIDEFFARYRSKGLKKLYNKLNVKNKKVKKIIRNVAVMLESLILVIVLFLILSQFYISSFLVPTSSMYPTIKAGERFFGERITHRFNIFNRGDILVFREPMLNSNRYTKRLIGLPGESIKYNNDNIVINGKQLTEDIYQKNFSDVLPHTVIEKNEWHIPEKGDVIKMNSADFLINQSKYSKEELKKLIKSDISNKSMLDDITRVLSAVIILNDKDLTGPIVDRDILYNLIMDKKVQLNDNYYFTAGDNIDNSYDSRFWGFVAERRIKGKLKLRYWPLDRFGLLN